MRITKSLLSKSITTFSSTVIKPNTTVFSAIQPTGVFHLGNYLGAVRSWVDIQNAAPDSTKLYYATADLHAITVPQDPETLRANRIQAIASILSTGINPERCAVYHQSDVPEHVQLNWLLMTLTGMGSLNRMVQWKSKANINELSSLESLNKDELSKVQLGLFAYPVLQAADVLIHNADYVPVGEDQSQHLELTRQIATTFNSRFGNNYTFPLPTTLFAPFKKINSLKNPSKKMSKSDPNKQSCIYITDSADEINKKIRKAVTDSIQGPITYEPQDRPGVANLIQIASGILGNKTPEELLKNELSNINSHAELKSTVADILTNELKPVRDRYTQLINNKDYLSSIAENGANKARESASITLKNAYKAMGYL